MEIDYFTDWLFSPDEKFTVIGKLDKLLRGRLLDPGFIENLPKVDYRSINRSGIMAASRSVGRGIDPKVLAQIQRPRRDSEVMVLAHDCSCSEHDCPHRDATLIEAVKHHSAEVAQELKNPERLRSRMALGSTAADLLELLDHDSSDSTQAPTGATPTSAGTSSLCFCLELDDAGNCSLLGIGTRRDNESWTTPLKWSALRIPIGVDKPATQSMDPYSRYAYQEAHPQTQVHLTEVEKRLVRHIFLIAGLDDSHRIDMTGKEWGTLLHELAATGQLFFSRSCGDPLSATLARKMASTWHADATAVAVGREQPELADDDDGLRWALKASIEGGAILIPCEPPWFVDIAARTIGPIKGKWQGRAVRFIAKAKGLKDSEVLGLKELAKKQATSLGLPPLPDIQIVSGGRISPRPIVTAKWLPNSRDIGAAVAHVSFDYLGQEIGATSPRKTFVVREGSKKVIYERDREYESEALRFVSNPKGVKKVAPGAAIAHGNLDDKKVRQSIQAYHDLMIPAFKKAGYQVRLGDGWHPREREIALPDYELTSHGDGTYAVAMPLDLDGTRIELIAQMVALIRNKKLMAGLYDEDTPIWLEETEEGYKPFVRFSVLAKLLPLITSMIHTKEDDTYRIRKIDFGALDYARSSIEGRLAGGDDLVQLSRDLAAIPPQPPQHLRDALEFPLWDHQAYGVSWINLRRKHGFGALLGDEYAAGKTLLSLATIWCAYAEPEATGRETSLILVSKTLLAQARWQQDQEKFLPGMRILVLPNKRSLAQLDTWDEPPHAVLSTYETVAGHFEIFNARRWNVIASDEGHKLGNKRTRIAKSLEALEARQKLPITGSAMQNTPMEMWSIMNISVKGLLRDVAWFKSAFPAKGRIDDIEDDFDQTAAGRANRARLVALGKVIAPFYLRRTHAELGTSLPKVNTVEHRVVLGSAQAEVYEAMRALKVAEVEAALEEQGISAFKLQALAMKLRQICNDPRLVGIEEVPSEKTTQIMEVCDDFFADRKKVVISSSFEQYLEILRGEFTQRGIGVSKLAGAQSISAKRKAMNDFSSGAVDVILIQLFMAEGIELPEGDALILCEPWWNAKKEEQALARIRRDERDKQVTLVRMQVGGSVEDGIRKIATMKLADVEAVHEGHASGDGMLTEADVMELFRPLPAVIAEDD